jgi:hypothetical protein
MNITTITFIYSLLGHDSFLTNNYTFSLFSSNNIIAIAE